jgi:hypothetical protein
MTTLRTIQAVKCKCGKIAVWIDIKAKIGYCMACKGKYRNR